MELPLPECPVCLQVYNTNDAVPRVLSCGHSACQSCLSELPHRFPHTIRCPACTQLVKLPTQGSSALPKNIDLLRLTQNEQTSNGKIKSSNLKSNSKPPKSNEQLVNEGMKLWDDGFYEYWKRWIIENDAVLLETSEENDGICSVLRGRVRGSEKVSLVRVGLLPEEGSSSSFRFSYVVRVMKFLSGMKEVERGELGSVFRVSEKRRGVCKVYGLWGDMESGVLYLVSESWEGRVLEKDGGFGVEGLGGFAMIGMEMCEALMDLHSEGVVLGYLGLSCFQADEFGRVYVNLGEVLVAGRKVRRAVEECGSSGWKGDGDEVRRLFIDLLKSDVFVNPELLFELLRKPGIELTCTNLRYSVGYESDIWSLAFCLLRLLLGKQFSDELADSIGPFYRKTADGNSSECHVAYTILTDKLNSVLDAKFDTEMESLQHLLCKCLSFGPESRPLGTDIWKCVRELICKPQYDFIVELNGGGYGASKGQCLVSGELCLLTKESTEVQKTGELQGGDDSNTNGDQLKEVKARKHIVEGILEGSFECKDMQGHLDCITGLAMGGGFLFSSSFDKTVKVWSLQDFSHVHTFKGHGHKVMAVVCTDEEQPLCISGDSEGGIFVWGTGTPLASEPLKKWYEQRDWRYSGIHALAVGGNGFVYTGSGDKSVKAWLLQDGTLSCTMTGHNSVVSTLTVCDGVLYSGSWDGSIRLWSLGDHSPLAVLAENTTRSAVLSLAADQHMLVAGYESGCIKIWKNDEFVQSTKVHSGAVLAIGTEGKWLFTGGWDKSVSVQEYSGDELQLNLRAIGSIPRGSVITAILCTEGTLFTGSGDRFVKAYWCEK